MKGLFRDAVIIVGARGFIRLSQALSFVLLARVLTPQDFGWFGLVTTAIGLAAILGSLGLRQSTAFQLGRAELNSAEATGTILALWPVLSLASASIIFLLYGSDLPDLSSWSAGGAIFLGTAGALLLMLLQGVYLGRGDIRSFSTVETSPRVTLTAFVGLLFITGTATIGSAIWAQAMSFVISVPVAILLATKRSWRLSVRFDKVPRLVSYGLAFAVNLFMITFCSRLSVFVIESYHGAAEAGQFFAAARANEILLEGATALGLVMFSKSIGESDARAVITKTARMACWLLWGFSLTALAIALFAPHLLKLILGDRYATAASTLGLLAFGLGAAAANKVIYPVIAGQGRPWFGSPAIVASLVINLALALYLVPTFRATGGAIALLAGQFVMLGGYIYMCHLRFDVPVRYFLLPQPADVRSVWQKMAKRKKIR